MIERLLVAQAALDRGQLDTAGRLFHQVAQADPRNVIAIVGLAQIALREDRFDDARDLAEQALAIDPDEAAAHRVVREAYAEARPAPEPVAVPPIPEAPVSEALPEAPVPETLLPAPPVRDAPVGQAPIGEAPVAAAPARRPSLLERIRRLLFGPRSR